MDLKAIKERCEKATPGPWKPEWTEGDTIRRLRPHSNVNLNAGAAWAVGPDARSGLKAKNDAAFIAHARTDLPALVAWAERAATYLRQLDMFGVGPSHWADGTWEEISQLLAELD